LAKVVRPRVAGPARLRQGSGEVSPERAEARCARRRKGPALRLTRELTRQAGFLVIGAQGRRQVVDRGRERGMRFRALSQSEQRATEGELRAADLARYPPDPALASAIGTARAASTTAWSESVSCASGDRRTRNLVRAARASTLPDSQR
jgi:hypothetical protein